MKQNIQLPEDYLVESNFPKIGGKAIIHTCTKNGEPFALKVFMKNFEQYQHEAFICDVSKKHSNAIQLIEKFDFKWMKILVLEYCQQSLAQYLQDPKHNQIDRILLFGQIVNSFKEIQADLSRTDVYLQHRDIKPDNLMIKDDKQIKLIDFGESRLISIAKNKKFVQNIQSTQLVGTPGYMDPMMQYFNEGFQEKSDLWSLGATFYHFLTKNIIPIEKTKISLISKENIPKDQKRLEKIKENELYSEHDRQCFELKYQLLGNLLRVDPKYRYDWQDLFSDSFIKQLLEITGKIEYCPSSRKKIIVLEQQIENRFLSPQFVKIVGPDLSEKIRSIIAKGQWFYFTAKNLFNFFLDIKEQNQIFHDNWQSFEKCNYLLHLKVLIHSNSYNEIITKRLNSHGRESIDLEALNKLTYKNMEIYNRIQSQFFFFLFTNINACFEGNGLTARILKLSKLQLQEAEKNEYSTELEITDEEKNYFLYNQNDPKKFWNNPENFDTDKFYEILQKYLEKCKNVFFLNYTSENITSAAVICLCYLQLCSDFQNNQQTKENIWKVIDAYKLKIRTIPTVELFKKLLNEDKLSDFDQVEKQQTPINYKMILIKYEK